MNHTATYSPDDNKLRLYPANRLDQATYERVRAAGFRWAPRQDLFVAPAWTPAREDLLTELCGTIDDEDRSLVDRAEERAERFGDYADRRRDDAHAARDAVALIADGIPLGQPILVGHHSERRARKDAERIRAGMDRAVRLWDQAKYWTGRAAGAIRHAKYKERPDVRARRIKILEADHRRHEAAKRHQEARIKLWSRPLTYDQARHLAGNTNTVDMDTYFELDRREITAEEAAARVLQQARECTDSADRWLAHIVNRLAYERAMLADAGGTVADRTQPEKGGAVRCWASPRGGWSYIQRVNRVSVTILDNWDNHGPNFRRTIALDKLQGVMSAAEVADAKAAGQVWELPSGIGFVLSPAAPPPPPPNKPEDDGGATFEHLRDTLRAGVHVVAAPSLFPTPAPLARQLVQLAEIDAAHRVLEPSAGTGQLLGAIRDAAPAEVVGVELSCSAAEILRAQAAAGGYGPCSVRCSDFLTCTPDQLGTFDRIVMNPPFNNGDDIRHIMHARTFLRPTGRLAAICANGPRQRERLQPLAAAWIDLPSGSFAEAGTNVETAIVILDADTPEDLDQ